jgi:hypothetical protein
MLVVMMMPVVLVRRLCKRGIRRQQAQAGHQDDNDSQSAHKPSPLPD